MSDEPRRVLRPVELAPEEAAVAYDAVCSINVPGGRIKFAAALLAKVEAAMVPETPETTETSAESADQT